MRIYTKSGDDGDTVLFGGRRVRKDDLRVAAYGEVDELNAVLGWAATQLGGLGLDEEIGAIQSDLFVVGADLATPDPDRETARIGPDHARRLEERIDRYEAENAPLKSFILPGGSPGAAALHVARTVCRRAERAAVRLAAAEEIDPAVLVYLNRLSDLLFVMARWANGKLGVAEPEWKPERE